MATILIVDDNATNRELLTTVLESDGHRLVEAENGAEALGLAESYRPNLVIADLLMPKMDGYEFVRRLRTAPWGVDTAVLFHTANYRESEVQELADACGVSDIIPKPVEPERILSMVRQTLERGAEAPQPIGDGEFVRRHLTLVNEKLLQKVQDLERVDEERRQLLSHLVTAQETERTRIAADIHDDSIQVMTAVAMRLEMLSTAVDDESRAKFERLQGSVQQSIARLRSLLFQLRPPALDREGLASAIEAYLEQESSGFTYIVDDRLRHEPPIELRVVLYRAVQEALVNVGKHARASNVAVTLAQNADEYIVTVEDDGVGFDASNAPLAGHIGLGAMRERIELAGGTFSIETSPGSGTRIEFSVPMRARG